MRTFLESWRAGQFPWRILLLAWLLAAWPARAAEPAFLEPEQAFRLSVETAVDGRASLTWQIAPGYYLYRDRIGVAGEGVEAVGKPPGKAKEDPNFGPVQVYHDSVTVTVDAPRASRLQVTWQGCAEGGLCYPPQERSVPLQQVSLQGQPPGDAPVPPGAGNGNSFGSMLAGSDVRIHSFLGETSLPWSVAAFFALGIALAFTPCVLPMVPILSALVMGGGATPRRGLLLSLAFVASMSLVYAALGVLAALAGSGLQAGLQAPAVLLAFSGLFVLLALAMFGCYELQLPAFLRDRLAAGKARGGSLSGAAAMGALSALLVGPCMTAPLAGTLLYIAQTGEAVRGAILLLALGLGMGLPLVIISTLGPRWLPRPGAWMNRVKGAFGFVMLGTAIWMAGRVLPAALVALAWGMLLTGLALTLWHIAGPLPGQPASPARLMARTSAAVAGLWGTAMVFGAAAGAPDAARPLAAFLPAAAVSGDSANGARFQVLTDPAEIEAKLADAAARGRPALVEFSADWCTSCKTIEREVFGDPRVPPALAGTLLLRADVTSGDAAQRGFMAKHQVMGPPTLMLFDGTGRERRERRLVGEFGADALLQRVAAGGRS